MKKSKELKVKKRIGEAELNREISELIGNEIIQVYYKLINYKDYEYEELDSVDKAVVLKFSNNKWISWIWSDEDEGNENFYHFGNYIDFQNRDKDVNSLIEVSNNKKWNEVVNQKVTDIQIERISDDNSYLCKSMKIEISNRVIFIRSTEEPDKSDNGDLEVELTCSPIWICVFFENKK